MSIYLLCLQKVIYFLQEGKAASLTGLQSILSVCHKMLIYNRGYVGEQGNMQMIFSMILA